ncbi:hypothetical protein GCM10023201_15900 [Actinomycetospora corticicola]|uniref:Putative lipoprotein with Yx(FWY)xxD motif n=1 Tax=Actinomycetospora corticicola TaxID=663602 RepID=A0A7Y9J5E7_9PSEU|nr:hypothetical protein [Actinomycetospora corticicola]NYD36052.1 putative lipoprotein with Yx(FWY)xxD motif [Actinomycetospora corticicola]
MRPDVQQDPRPEFGIPVPRDARRYDGYDAPRTGGYPAAPYSGPIAGPASGPQPVSPYGTGAHAAQPYSGPQPVSGYPTTGPRGLPERPMSGPQSFPHDVGPRGAAEPTVRRRLADDVEPRRRDEHPSGPLPTGGHRRGARGGRGRTALLALVAAGAVAAGAAGYVAIAHWGTSSDQAVATTAGAGQVAPTSLTGANLATRQTPLGTVATSDGYTLYSFTKDSNKPAASTCTGTCAEQWPPVLASDADPWLKGIDASRVGTVDRPDGTKQLTLNGWPLYRFAKDAAPGETAGNGVGGTWRAVGPDGKPVAANAAAPAAGGSSTGTGGSGGGYSAPAAPAAPAGGGSSYGDAGGSSGY